MTSGERKVILMVIAELRAAGYAPVAVWDGEEYHRVSPKTGEFGTPIGAPASTLDYDLTDEQALSVIESVDEATLHFTHQHKRTWGNRGCKFVMGNDPYGTEVLADHHYPEGEDFSRILDAITDRLIDEESARAG